MYIRVDLGTSDCEAILLSEQGDVLATQTENCRFRVRIRYGRNRIRSSGGKRRIAQSKG